MSAKKTILILSTILLADVAAMAATQAQINGAINNGVAWLVTQQDTTGYWHGDSEDGDFPAAGTGLALIKLEERAFELGYSPFDPCYPYEQNVEKGLAYLFSQMSIISISIQPAGNPDISGDGNGVCVVDYSTYETGIAMMAIAASRAPNMVVNSPGSPVNGWTYKKVLQDMVDFMAFGQCDSGGGRGGWTYNAVDNGGKGADNSNSGYAVEGLGYAESPFYGFSCTIPQFVKDELKIWINYIQANGGSYDGGSGYDGPRNNVNILKTGNLIFQMTFVGIPSADPNIQRALAYIGRTWNDPSPDPGWGNPAYWGLQPSFQAMYCTANGLWYSDINTIVVDGNQRDWYADFADAIVNAQQTDGSWPSDPTGTGGNVLATEWALLTLEMPTSGTLPPAPGMLTKVDDVNGCVNPDSDVNYTICYNAGNYSDTNVMITDYLPNEVNYISSNPNGTYNPDTNTVTWDINFSAGSSGCITLAAQVKNNVIRGGTITNSCELKGDCVDINTNETTPVCSSSCPIYVDISATGAKNGSSWADAFTNLQDALKDYNCSEIRVAQGIYRPDINSAYPNGTGDRTATFQLINGVAIYGGFPTGGGTMEARNPAAYQTILSGDLLGNDRQVAEPCDLLNDPCRADNSYNVVTATEIGTTQTTVLDGFTITGGNANGNGSSEMTVAVGCTTIATSTSQRITVTMAATQP